MDQAGDMHRRKRKGDAREQGEAPRAIETGLYRLAERRSLDELLDDERVAALHREHAEHARDSRMIEPRRRDHLGACRLQQSIAQRGIVVCTARGALDGHLDAELEIIGMEYLAEGAGPERALAHEALRRVDLGRDR